MRQMRELSEQNRRKYKVPIEISGSGVFKVAGYLITKEFSVILDSLDKVAQVTYDLEQNEFKVTGEQVEGYTIVRHIRNR
ncbi:hypothetical protein D3C76_1665370 [compost metagenome]